jgi:WD40 repeat protein
MAFALNPAGRWLYASADDDLRTSDDQRSGYFAVDLSTGKSVWLGLHAGYTLTLAVHPTGEWFVGFGYTDNREDRRLTRWIQPREGLAELEWVGSSHAEQRHCGRIACDPHRPRLISLESYHGGAAWIPEIVTRNPITRAIEEKVPVPGQSVDQLAISPDGSALIVSHTSSLLVWNADSLSAKPKRIRSGKHGITGVAFHPSGRYLAATSNDQTVKLYDTQSWELAKTYTWDIGRMRSIAFSPDGTLAAAGSDTGKVVVWDVDL